MRRRQQLPPQLDDWLSQRSFDELATFNSEVERGLLHTQDYQDRMARLQGFYDMAMRPMEQS